MIKRIWKYTIMFLFVVLFATAIILLAAVPVLMIKSGISGDGSVAQVALGSILVIILYPAFFIIGSTLWRWRKDEIIDMEVKSDEEHKDA